MRRPSRGRRPLYPVRASMQNPWTLQAIARRARYDALRELAEAETRVHGRPNPLTRSLALNAMDAAATLGFEFETGDDPPFP